MASANSSGLPENGNLVSRSLSQSNPFSGYFIWLIPSFFSFATSWMFQVDPMVDSGKLKEMNLYGVYPVQELQCNCPMPPWMPPHLFLNIWKGQEKWKNKLIVEKMAWPSCCIGDCSMTENTWNPFSSAFPTEWTWASFSPTVMSVGTMWCHGQQCTTKTQRIFFSSRFWLITQKQTTLSNCLFKQCNLLAFQGEWPSLESNGRCPRRYVSEMGKNGAC